MAEAHPLFSIFILILSALVVYWILVGQRKQREMLEAGIEVGKRQNVKKREIKLRRRASK